MESIISSHCDIHQVNYLHCTKEGCEKLVCKVCCFKSKEEAVHLGDHFEFITELNNNQTKIYEKYLKDDESYHGLNKVFLEYMEKIEPFVESTLEKVYRVNNLMVKSIHDCYIEKYNIITSNFEELVKNLTTLLANMNMNDKKVQEEVRNAKKEFEKSSEYLSSSDKIEMEFKDALVKAESQLKRIKIEDIINEKVKFHLVTHVFNSVWQDGYNRVVTVSRERGYWCVRSQEILEGAFTARVRIVEIKGKVDKMWNYGFGVSMANSTQDASYYNEGYCWFSNGQVNNKSSAGAKITYSPWKTGDEIVVKRDDQNNVFFGFGENETALIRGFQNVTGPLRIVLGFISTVPNGDVFDLIEIKKLK